jgi:arylformamidase
MDSDWRKWSLSELEQQMSPSRWNPCKNPDEVIKEYIDVSLNDTNKARTLIPTTLNISYGSLPSQLFDLYGTDLSDDAPIFFNIHGGYWQEGTKDIAGGIAIPNHKIGMKTVAFGYTLAPAAKIADMEKELIAALNVLIKMSPQAKLILGGHSAGGQLASSLLHSKSLPTEIANRLAGLVLISGVYDLLPLVPTYVNNPLKMDDKEAESLSGQLQSFNNIVHFENLKTLVLVGGHDSPEFQRQSEEYFEKLKQRTGGERTIFLKSETDDHFTIVQNLANESTELYKKVHEFLKGFTPTPAGLSSVSALSAGVLSLFMIVPIIFTR